jgi:hypothetical protein
MNDRRSGKVLHAEGRQPSASPDPVPDDGVDRRREDDTENEVDDELVRSAMPPQTMARLTAQKTTSKRYLAARGMSEKESEAKTVFTSLSGTARPHPEVPKMALPVPKQTANPTAQKTRLAMEKITMFFTAIWPALLARVSPASRRRTRPA